HPLAVEAPVLDADRPVAALERDPLAVRTGKGPLCLQGVTPCGGTALVRPPHPADSARPVRIDRLEGKFLADRALLDREAAEGRLAPPGAEADGAGGERTLAVLEIEDGPIIDADLQAGVGHPHGQVDPAADRHVAGHVADRLPVVAVAPEDQVLPVR